MTQEELDALMAGAADDMDTLDDEVIEEESDSSFEEMASESESDAVESTDKEENDHYLPLPATDENKMVHQLDDVTKESEEKASEIFDIIERISNDLMDKEDTLNSISDILISNKELFTTLTTKFPDVEAFQTQLSKNEDGIAQASEAIEILQNSGDSIMNVMDIMQYQDIHRQKIERVINVMRALSRYMNTLFEGKIDDANRVSSAQHIAGDEHTDLASTDDIEALLEQFGK